MLGSKTLRSTALLLGACASLSAIGCKAARDPRSDVAVRIETATETKREAKTTYLGAIRADKQVELAFRAGGFVDSIAPFAIDLDKPKTKGSAKHGLRPIQAGDHVTKNGVLASLRLADFRAQMNEAGGMSREASSGYRKAKGDLERAKKLFANGSISQAELDDARARHDALAGGAAAAGGRASQAALALGDAQLRSPIDGILIERRVEVGALVAPGVAAFVVADTSTVKVGFAVPDTVAQALEIGHEVIVTTDALSDRSFAGRVTKIAAQADARTRVFDIEASFDNTDGVLKIGMPAKIELAERAAKENAILVPLGAVVRRPTTDEGFSLFILEDSTDGLRVKARDVEASRLVGNRVAVVRGLVPGERVVVQGATLLTDGARVVVVPGGS